MRITFFQSLSVVLLLVGVMVVSGCGESTPETKPVSETEQSNSEAADEDVASREEAGFRSVDLKSPYRLRAGGEFVDAEIGHAAPLIGDINNDNANDLLVGQFKDGKLKVCLNRASNEDPDYAAPVWFEAAGDVAKVPTG